MSRNEIMNLDETRETELCEIDEAIGSRPPVSSGLGALGQLGSAVLVVGALVLCFIGVFVVWTWLFG